MIIELPLEGTGHGSAGEPVDLGNERFLRAVVGGEFLVRHRSVTAMVERPRPVLTEVPGQEPAEPEPTCSLLLRAAHVAFADHLPLSLSPDVLWYAVVHEVAVHVRMYPPRYRALFGAANGARVLSVRDDTLIGRNADWARSLRLVREPLTAALGADVVRLFRPDFSTTTPDDEASALVALMDVVSPYYDFRWETRCGIPKVRLEGTAEDWALLAARAGELAERFDWLAPWFAELRPVLAQIAATAAGGPVDEAFWRSLYKWQSVSGGPRVTGWLTAFFAHTQTPDGPRLRQTFGWREAAEWPYHRDAFAVNDFPSHLSTVPFVWECLGVERPMAFVGGVLGIERDGEFLRPRLGHAVLERVSGAGGQWTDGPGVMPPGGRP
ncbi:DUF4419 domain-containing protein [Kitasatospora aureofaciens]|uniref:DUF4419 domain-containing protein n=1 Tax=Kitasatospora aureofaciens TaxID=1894 RepID=UPI001DF6702A|nr:DUF4419 domain-containing protein [Kitasatospora aureofaciens]HJD81095.1 DUF4419 domain-containing protein [Kitasatospora aureofaciens]